MIKKQKSNEKTIKLKKYLLAELSHKATKSEEVWRGFFLFVPLEVIKLQKGWNQ